MTTSPGAGATGPSLARQGILTALPVAVGVVPFGLVAGAAPIENGMGIAEAMGFSVIVFAGAAQLAAIDLLADGAGAGVAILSILLINLRMLMYSAGLAPHFAQASGRSRLGVSYMLTDQAFALSVDRFTGDRPIDSVADRLAFHLPLALTFAVTWVITTAIGAVAGSSIPESIPLDFAVPLAFLALLIPAVVDRPRLVAALVGGGATVAAAEVGVGDLSLAVGAVLGIVSGVVADEALDRRRRNVAGGRS